MIRRVMPRLAEPWLERPTRFLLFAVSFITLRRIHPVKRLPEVEEAKALMTEAMSWSVMKWLRDKKKVRKTADKANNALWVMQKEVRAMWPPEQQSAYNELADGKPARGRSNGAIDPEALSFVKRVKDADDEAWRAHMDAEETFAKAEKILSTSMARDGCRVTLNSWELFEKAIEEAEAGIHSKAGVK